MNTIDNIIFDTSAMTSALAVRQFTIIGDPGAQFTMTVTNEDNHFYNFSEERVATGISLIVNEDIFESARVNLNNMVF